MQIKFKPWTPPAVTLDKMPEGEQHICSHPTATHRVVVMRWGSCSRYVRPDGTGGELVGIVPVNASEFTVLDATPTPTHSGDLPPGVWFETCCQPHPLTKTVEDGKYVSTQGRLFRPAQNEYFPVTRILGTMEVEDAG